MFSIIAQLHDMAEALENDHKRSDLSDVLDKIASYIVAKYKFRIHRPRKSRGTLKTKRRIYYKTHKQRQRRRMIRYRKIHRVPLHRRKMLRHYHRFG